MKNRNLYSDRPTISARDFTEYSIYEAQCPVCGGVATTEETPYDEGIATCRSCDACFEISGDW